MTTNDIKCVLSINHDLSIHLILNHKNITKDKHQVNTKLGQAGWNLYRKYHIDDYNDTMLSGNQKTSIIAKHWKALSKEEKEKWKYTATHSTECGNRWAMFI